MSLFAAISKFDKRAELSLDWYNVFVPDADGKSRVVGHVQADWVVEADKKAKAQHGDKAHVRVIDPSDGKAPIGLEFGKRPALMGTTKIKFRPGEVDGMVDEALRMLPGKPPRSKHDAAGSTVEFHNANQLHTYIKWLHDYVNDAEMSKDPEMKDELDRVKDTIRHITSQMPQATDDGNAVLASRGSMSILSAVAKFDKQAEHDPNKWWVDPEFQAGNARMKEKGMIPVIKDYESRPVGMDEQSRREEEELAPYKAPMLHELDESDQRALSKQNAHWDTWRRAMQELDDISISDGVPTGYLRQLYHKGLTVSEALEMMWGEDPGHSEASVNPLLQAVAKFDRRADYKVKPPVEPSKTESKQLKKYKDDDYPRAGSDSIKGIEKLYNVKHECYDYKDNIMEDAHPDKLILLPAYDKMNGLLENHMERQKINLNILRKPVSGLEYRQKYAELMKSLLKTANDMDFQKQEPLYTLADKTIESLQKEAFDLPDSMKRWFGETSEDVKDVGGALPIGAIGGGLIGALVGGPAGAWTGALIGGAVTGLIASVIKTGPVAKNVQLNAKDAEKALRALEKDHPNDVFLSSLITSVTHIQDTAANYAALTSQMQATQAHPGLDSMSGQAADPQKVMQVAQEYVAEIHKLDGEIDTFKANAEKGDYAPNEPDWESKMLSPLRGIGGGAVHDAVEAVGQLERVSEAAIEGINHVKETAGASPQAAAPVGDAEAEALRAIIQSKQPK